MIAVIDYGLGNLRSVSKALESVGADVVVTSKPEEILKAKGVVFPGVGAFNKGMENLKEKGLIDAVYGVIREGIPFLGICLGLQLLFTESEEHGRTSGLGIIKGRVRRFEGNMKVPHMGWNQVCVKKPETSNRKPDLFKEIPDEEYFYFVHSYFVEPKDESVVIGTTNYGGEFTSAVQKDNVWGVQFHPEKSSGLGLKVLKNFIDIVSKL